MTHGMISAPQPETVETAIDILSAGGKWDGGADPATDGMAMEV